MRLPFKYILQAFQKDQFWLPAALWALFVMLVGIFIQNGEPEAMGRAFLGYLLPLISGGLAAYAVLQDDALELQFSTARPAWRMLLERLGIVLGVITLTALSFQLVLQLFSVDLGWGDFWHTQRIWLIPNLAVICAANLISLLGSSSHSGFAFIGVLWIMELLMKDLLMSLSFGRMFLIFFGTMAPNGEGLDAHHLTMLLIILGSVLLSVALLKKQERYI